MIEAMIDNYRFYLLNDFPENAERAKVQLLAALRAGQEMRAHTKLKPEPLTGYCSVVDRVSTFGLAAAAEAWDAATKGEG